MKADKQAKIIEKIIRQAWSSLESHLEYTYSKDLNKGETNAFHKRCVEEYIEIIKNAAKLYRK